MTPEQKAALDAMCADNDVRIKRREQKFGKRNNDEQRLQIALCNWLEHALPELMFFAVPNGGARSIIEASLLKKQGVKPGVADLLFMHKGQVYAMELKNPNGRGVLSDSQKAFAERWRKNYGLYACCKNGNEIVAQFIGWGFTPKHPFPLLEGSKKQMRQMEVAKDMYER